jgi:hypothetical protein
MFVPHTDSVSRLERTFDGFPEEVKLRLQPRLVLVRVNVDAGFFPRPGYGRRRYAIYDRADGCSISTTSIAVTIPAPEFLVPVRVSL